MATKMRIKINSDDKVEELLQETYNQACEQINQIQMEMNKLSQSTSFNDLVMDEKAKYSKSMHDFLGDKDKAIRTKMDIAKLLAEIINHKGDVSATLADKAYTKQPTSLNFEELRKSLNNNPNTYKMK